MLANLYVDRFLKHWRITGKSKVFRAQVVTHADDFVTLSRGHAAEALDWTRSVMTRLGLTLNEAKTGKAARKESFHFLGYTFGTHRYNRMVIGILEPVHPRRAGNASSRRWATC
jgi:RNA-directed DNA polymerase